MFFKKKKKEEKKEMSPEERERLEKIVNFRFAPETKQKIIEFVKSDATLLSEFIEKHGDGCLDVLCNPDDVYEVDINQIYYTPNYMPLYKNNLLYYTCRIMHDVYSYELHKPIFTSFRQGDGLLKYKLICSFAELLKLYVNEKTYEEFIDVDSNECLKFIKDVYDREISDIGKYYISSYVVNCMCKKHYDVFEKDKILLEKAFLPTPGKFSSDFIDEFNEKATYKECLANVE